jgi:hypothetical protein
MPLRGTTLKSCGRWVIDGGKLMDKPIRRYFDWAATALPDPGGGALPAVFGNPSSIHTEGRNAGHLLESAPNRENC